MPYTDAVKHTAWPANRSVAADPDKVANGLAFGDCGT